ncbi:MULTISPECIES: hypothetical protein [unclassified Sphingobium]|uniref:hypothetical protein n=1 Tax=unclassified Sphingobium TaxID=2611147 RepID=UPI0022251C82|nr:MULTISPECIES: hypothetical protein [unclassified Sphingobium]MCW2411751.1 hypothetical protein [Sphingobium sp. B8D3D]MCW2415953.1 hypothetical protein [Sphingobium sp. B8D3A]
MKIQILVRSADWMQSAGARIRYRRLESEFSRLGCMLAIDPMSSIREGLKLNADAYIFSKCHDAGALMLAEMLREAGSLVGFDLFDDYVSGTSSLTFGQRDFQRSLSGKVDFLLCSTERMASVVTSIDASIPVHVLNDPVESIHRARLAGLLDAKMHKVRHTGQISVVWFGQGTNPIFPVGISDLAGFSDCLQSLMAGGRDVRLKVLTSAAALDGSALSLLRSLPCPTQVQEWSVEAEAASLDAATVAFLPVNYQSFSIAKSLNRAITALAHGTQVLAAGYPLYDALGDMIYTTPADLTGDLERGSLKLSPATIPLLFDHFSTIANPGLEAKQLVSFLNALPAGPVQVSIAQRQPRAIIHGAGSSPAVHTLGRALGWLSLASPLTRQPLPYSARIGFFENGADLQLRIARSALGRLQPGWYDQARVLVEAEDEEFSHVMPMPDTPAGAFLRSLSPIMIASRAGRMIYYDEVMAATENVFGEIFGTMTMMRSEMESPLTGMSMIGTGRA